MRSSLIYRLLLFGLIAFSLSCQKDSDGDTGTGYFVKIKKNGSWVNYTQVAGEYGPDLWDASKTNLTILGGSNDQNETFDLNIQIDGTNIPAGSYASDNSGYYVLVSYITGYTGSNDMAEFINDNAPARDPSKYIITIASITATEISGSFTGNYLYNPMAGGGAENVVNITEGTFKVKRVR